MGVSYDKIFLRENLEKIDDKYEEKIEEAHAKAQKDAQIQEQIIIEYRTLSLEEIYKLIESRAIAKYEKEIYDEYTLERAIQKEYEKTGERPIPRRVIKEVKEELSYEVKAKLIKKYRDILCQEYIDRQKKIAEKDIKFFSTFTDQESTDYVAKYEDMCFAEYLFQARKTAIREVASALGVNFPISTKITEPTSKKARKIVKTEMQDKNDINFVKKICDGFARVHYILSEYPVNVIRSVMMGATLGCIIAAVTYKPEYPVASAVAVALLSIPPIMAATDAFVHSDLILDKLEDKAIVIEATRLGLFDRSKEWCKSTEEFNRFNKSLRKKKMEERINGGNNGLQKQEVHSR